MKFTEKPFIAFLMLLLCLTGCRTVQRDTVIQYSSLPIVESGRITGENPLSELLKRGDFGIAYPDNMDGVIIILDGRPFHIADDGNVRDPENFTGIPLASVCNFMIDATVTLPENCSLTTLREILDSTVPDKNLFCAIQVKGRFHRVEANSPAGSISEKVKKDGWMPRIQRFPLKKVSGTLVGFRFPKLAEGIHQPGYRFGFIADNLMSGGLVDDFVLADGTAEIDICSSFSLEIPSADKTPAILPTEKDTEKENI